jgi:hypothetical protein
VEDTLARVWRTTDETAYARVARRYVRQIRPIVRAAAELERRQLAETPRPPETLEEPTAYGDWTTALKLGSGGDGDAFLAVGPDGQTATLKTPAGAEVYVWSYLSHDAAASVVSPTATEGSSTSPNWHPRLVRIFDGELASRSLLRPRPSWVARSYADTSLLDTWRASRGHGGFPLDDALDVFAAACDVVAWLHARGVYRWSAHARNILRVKGQWQVADLGRSLILVDEDHWATTWLREQRHQDWYLPVGVASSTGSAWWSFVDALRWAALWSHRTNGFWPKPVGGNVEDRLRRDDCATLGGLLAQLLSGTRFDHFLEALRPSLCTATYQLTGEPSVDRRLSDVINRAWLGDAGGALGVAADVATRCKFGGGYANALEMLADVRDGLTSP